MKLSDIVVAVLTGGRPSVLAKTLESFAACGGSELETVALVNGADSPTLELFRRFPWVSVHPRRGPIRRIGAAVSDLMALAVDRKPLVLHLEDDWLCKAPLRLWVPGALDALEDASVGQVRLRLDSEKVMRVSMRTGARIRWMKTGDQRRSSNAHLTFNPNLMRASDVRCVYPCESEPDAQAHFAHMDLDVVQLVPGAFAHIGRHSLRQQLRGGRH